MELDKHNQEYLASLNQGKVISDDVLREVVKAAAESFCAWHNCTLDSIGETLAYAGYDVPMSVSMNNRQAVSLNGYMSFHICMTMHGMHLTAPAYMAVIAGRQSISVIGADAPQFKEIMVKEIGGRHILHPHEFTEICPIISRNFDPSTNSIVDDNVDTGGFYRQ